MVSNPLNELRKTLELQNSKEGMSQYILMTFAEDILVSPDIMVLTLLNSKYHNLDILDHNMALNEAQMALEASTHRDIVDVEVSGGKVRFRPKIVNDYEDTTSFVLMSKTGRKFILRDVYNKYFKECSTTLLIADIYMNKNCSNILSTDSNYLCYDDSIPFMKEVLMVFITGSHKERLIPLSKLADFMCTMATERETVFDFITSDINDILVDLHEEVGTRITNGLLPDEAAMNIKLCSLIGNVTMRNVKTMDAVTPPGYSIGLMNLFRSDLASKR